MTSVRRLCCLWLVCVTDVIPATTVPRIHPRQLKPPDTTEVALIRRRRFSDTGKGNLWKWMKNYGYLPKNVYERVLNGSENDVDPETSATLEVETGAIRLFKLVYNTSESDGSKTIDKPRCGNPDFNYGGQSGPSENSNRLANSSRRSRRSHLDVPGSVRQYWRKREVIWKLMGHPSVMGMSESEVNDQLKMAVSMWSPHLPFRFRQARWDEIADMQISFEYREHGDGFDFDGPGGVIGHAFPPDDGRIHIDADETYTSQHKHLYNQFNLRFVVAHEIGHALGLAHSYSRDSIMFPLYLPFPSGYAISTDDKDAVRAIYGSAQADKTVLRYPRPWCIEMMDSALQIFGRIHVFIYDFVYTQEGNSVRPARITSVFPSMESDVMASVFSEATGYAYLFKAWRVWRYKASQLAPGYPKSLEGALAPFNSHGAIFHRGRVYLLKENVFYAFDERTSSVQGYDSIYAVNELILGAPHNISRAFSAGRIHYLLTDNLVYAYNSDLGLMLEGYPRSRRTKQWLLCT